MSNVVDLIGHLAWPAVVLYLVWIVVREGRSYLDMAIHKRLAVQVKQDDLKKWTEASLNNYAARVLLLEEKVLAIDQRTNPKLQAPQIGGLRR